MAESTAFLESADSNATKNIAPCNPEVSKFLYHNVGSTVMVPKVILSLSLLFLLLTVSTPTNAADLHTQIDIQLISVSGQEQSPNIFPSNDLLTITYGTSQQADLYLVINGSSYRNQTIKLDYYRYDAGAYTYRLQLTLTSYTRFFAFTNSSGFSTEQFSGMYPYHRLWTTNDQAPFFQSVTPAVAGVVDTDIDPRLMSSHIARDTNQVTIKYLSLMQIPSAVTLHYGTTPELGQTMPMVQDPTNTNEYNADLPAFDRELWFTAESENSYEYNDHLDDLALHRITNGIAIEQSELFGRSNVTLSADITDQHVIYLNTTTYNETGAETLTVQLYVNDRHSDTINPDKISSEQVNHTTFTSYTSLIGKYNTSTALRVVLLLNDTTTGRLVARSEITTTVGVFGPSLAFEHLPEVTRNEQLTIDFIINDNNKGLSLISLQINDNTTSLPLSSRNQTISLNPGNNTITLSVTTANNETTSITATIYRDTNPAIISLPDDDALSQSGDYLLKGSATDDYGIRSVLLSADNTTQEIFSSTTGQTTVSINHLLRLSTGDHVLNITVIDMVGNTISHLLEVSVTAATTSSSPVFILWMILPLLRRRRQ